MYSRPAALTARPLLLLLAAAVTPTAAVARPCSAGPAAAPPPCCSSSPAPAAARPVASHMTVMSTKKETFSRILCSIFVYRRRRFNRRHGRKKNDRTFTRRHENAEAQQYRLITEMQHQHKPSDHHRRQATALSTAQRSISGGAARAATCRRRSSSFSLAICPATAPSGSVERNARSDGDGSSESKGGQKCTRPRASEGGSRRERGAGGREGQNHPSPRSRPPLSFSPLHHPLPPSPVPLSPGEMEPLSDSLHHKLAEFPLCVA